MDRCPRCGATLRTLLLCESCQALQEPVRPPTPFEALGLEPGFALDPKALQKRLRELSRGLHPDYFGTADEATRARAQHSTAELNGAFQVLADEAQRADYLVGWLGGPREDQERSMPLEFLQEVLEWNEAIEEARTSGPDSAQRKALEPLERRLASERSTLMHRVAETLTPLPPRGAPALSETRKLLNAIRYLDRALGEIAELRLVQSTSRQATNQSTNR